MPNSGTIDMGGLADTLHDLKQTLPTPVSAPIPVPDTTPTTPAPTTGQTGGTGSGGGHTTPAGGGNGNYRFNELFHLQQRENGGPVSAGTPYIVGEKQPEVFVPHTSGTIVPQVPQGFATALPSTQQPSQYSGSNPYNPSPGNPSDAVNTFANSAGMNFILDQGQKAISGASAANGTFNSGATGKALQQYGQNLGKTYLGDYMNRLLDYAKLGLGSASALSGAGGTNISQSSQGGGSLGTSFGSSQSTGSSTSTSTGTGTSSGSGNSKKGLVPDILG